MVILLPCTASLPDTLGSLSNAVLWPDFKRDHLYEAVKAYQTRDRRFGGLNDE